MSLFDKIRNYKHSDWISFQGTIELTDKKVKITPDPMEKDTFILVDESAINEDFVSLTHSKPCSDHSEPIFNFQIRKGAEVEIHYKNLVHTFLLDPTKGQFRIDTEKMEIVPITTQYQFSMDESGDMHI